MARCGVCGREFSSEQALSQHLRDKHQGAQQGAAEKARPSRANRKSLRKRNRHPVAIGIGVAAVVLGLGLYLVIAPSLAPTPVPCSSGESWIHVHPYLSISIEGTNVAVPAQIGFLNQCPSGLELMHTHDASGIIHIELSQTDAPTGANYTLGDFFRVWSATFPTVTINGTTHPVVFTNTDIFGYTADATHKVVVLVDGKPVSNGVGVPLEQLDYCNSTNANVPPCYPTAGGNPLWGGGSNYPYGTDHTVVIEYVTV